MECVCHVTVALQWNSCFVLEEAVAWEFWMFSGKLEAQGSWESAGTLGFGVQDANSPLKIALEGVVRREAAHSWFLLLTGTRNEEFASKNITSIWKSPGRWIHLPWPHSSRRTQSLQKLQYVCALLYLSRTLASVICHSWEPGCASLRKTPKKSILCPGKRQWKRSQQGNLIFKTDTSGKCLRQSPNSLIMEMVFIQRFIQDNCREINPHLSLRLLGRQFCP